MVQTKALSDTLQIQGRISVPLPLVKRRGTILKMAVRLHHLRGRR